MIELQALAGMMSLMAYALMMRAGSVVGWLLFIVMDKLGEVYGGLGDSLVCHMFMTSSTGQWSEPYIAVCIDALSTKGMILCEHTK